MELVLVISILVNIILIVYSGLLTYSVKDKIINLYNKINEVRFKENK
jgi:cell division protein FtsL